MSKICMVRGLLFDVFCILQTKFFWSAIDVLVFSVPEDSGVILTEDVNIWLDTAKEVATKILNEDSFEHLTQAATGATTGDWLVIL